MSAKSIDSCQAAKSAQADMDRNLLLPLINIFTSKNHFALPCDSVVSGSDS